MTTTPGLMVFNTTEQMLNLIRLAQNNPSWLDGRNAIVGIAELMARSPKPTTDAGEIERRVTSYKGATAMLAWAGAVINDAVENGMDVGEATDPLSFLLLAAAGYTYVHAYVEGEDKT